MIKNVQIHVLLNNLNMIILAILIVLIEPIKYSLIEIFVQKRFQKVITRMNIIFIKSVMTLVKYAIKQELHIPIIAKNVKIIIYFLTFFQLTIIIVTQDVIKIIIILMYLVNINVKMHVLLDLKKFQQRKNALMIALMTMIIKLNII